MIGSALNECHRVLLFLKPHSPQGHITDISCRIKRLLQNPDFMPVFCKNCLIQHCV